MTRMIGQSVGRVTFVAGELFKAAFGRAEEEFNIAEVSESDHALIVEGNVFYQTIYHRDSQGGQRERVTELRFARPPLRRAVSTGATQ